jgi:protein-L-isoaspartate(D-aspartate) O-methyltransferase
MAARRGFIGAVVARGVLVLALACAALAGAWAADGPERDRREMVAEIRQLGQILGTEIDAATLAAVGKVPRHEFVPWLERPFAYDNRPLPIGHGQTISQPYMVAAMTALLKVGAGATVLEIGTGSGYQAAVLAELGATVATIEIVEPLAVDAKERLRRLGYATVTTRAGDGYEGWPERAPFDGIVVTAAASHVPPPLVRQLKAGGRMVIPVGVPFQVQQLLLVEKQRDGTVTTRQVMPVRFVPLTGGH